MLPSEKLRVLIEENTGLPFHLYAWDERLKKEIFNIKTDKYIEPNVRTLEEVYKNGFNIGHCGLTARYFSRNYFHAELNVGTLKAIIGTKSATNGSHCWVEMDGYLLDPTLMVLLPIELKDEFGYHTKYVVEKDSSLELSEYDIYDYEFEHMNTNIDKYTDSLYTISTDDIKKR